MTDPDNISDGYGGLDMEPIWQMLFIIALVIIIIMGIYIAYLKYKLMKDESKEIEENPQDKDKQEE